MNAFNIENLSVTFDGETVLEGLSYQLQQGEKLAITGESGSGKTTLLNVLAGFVLPVEGKVTILDDVLNAKTITSIRSKMAWVPQELHFPVDTVRELLLLPFNYHKNKDKTPSEADIKEIMERLGLNTSLLEKSVHEISGGQKQRILITSSYFLQKPLMILDEPTSALDRESKQKVMDLLYEQQDLTLIAVTHDAEWIEASDKTLNLE